MLLVNDIKEATDNASEVALDEDGDGDTDEDGGADTDEDDVYEDGAASRHLHFN